MKVDLYDKSLDVLRESLNLRSLNQNVITSNITNADTPNYKAKNVNFERQFENFVEDLNNDTGTTSSVVPEIVEDNQERAGNDGNTVNLDTELSKLAKNTIMYNASSTFLSKKLKLLKYAITTAGGK